MKQTILLAVIFATGFYVNAQNRFANSFTGDFNDWTFKNFDVVLRETNLVL